MFKKNGKEGQKCKKEHLKLVRKKNTMSFNCDHHLECWMTVTFSR